MVCKKCGIKLNSAQKECPNCGVRQEKIKKNKINKFEKELEKLKMGEAPSTLSNGKVHPNIKQIPKIDFDEIINAFEDLKIKEIPKHEFNKNSPSNTKSKKIEKKSTFIEENNEPFETMYNKQLEEDISQEKNFDTKYYIEQQETHNQYKKENKPKTIKNINLNNNKINLIVGLSIFAFIFIIGLFMLYSLVLSPKAKFMNSLEIQYSNIINKINNLTNGLNSIINSNEIQLNTTAKVKNTENGKTNNYIINSKYLESEKEQKQYFEYSNLNQTKTELKRIYIQNNTLYINQENSTNDYYTLNSKYISLKNFLKTDNIDYIVKIITKTSTKILNNNNFEAKKKTININEQNYKVKEISLILDEELYKKIYTSILEKIETDKSALHILSDYTKYSMDEVKKLIDNKIHFLNNHKIKDFKFKYTIYLDENNNTIKQELKTNENRIEYINIKQKQELKIYNNEKEVISFDSQTKNNKTLFNIKTENNIKGEYIKEKETNIVNFQINDSNNNNAVVNTTITKNKEEKEIPRYDIYMAIQSNGFNNKNYFKNIEIATTLEETSHFEIVDIPIQNNILPMPIDKLNELKQKFSMFIK